MLLFPAGCHCREIFALDNFLSDQSSTVFSLSRRCEPVLLFRCLVDDNEIRNPCFASQWPCNCISGKRRCFGASWFAANRFRLDFGTVEVRTSQIAVSGAHHAIVARPPGPPVTGRWYVPLSGPTSLALLSIPARLPFRKNLIRFPGVLVRVSRSEPPVWTSAAFFVGVAGLGSKN